MQGQRRSNRRSFRAALLTTTPCRQRVLFLYQARYEAGCIAACRAGASVACRPGSLIECGAAAGTPVMGKKTRKQVRLPRSPRKVRQVRVPSYFCTMPLLIQRPRPVPLVDLVLKNGWKRRFASSGWMPMPVSTMEMAVPRAVARPIGGFAHVHAAACPLRHGLNGIADEVEKHLAELNRESCITGRRRVFLAARECAWLRQRALLQFEHIVQQFGADSQRWAAWIRDRS